MSRRAQYIIAIGAVLFIGLALYFIQSSASSSSTDTESEAAAPEGDQ